MATPKSQRIAIWIIAIALTLGTLGSFLVIALASQNQKIDQAAAQKIQDEYNQVISDYQNKLIALGEEQAVIYYDEFSKYASVPAKFDAGSVKELVKKDLKVGDGSEIAPGSQYNTFYIGWNPDGVIFDQSINGDKLKSPLTSGGNMIKGWDEGIIGMKIGGVREITIPSDLAYGETGQGDDIPPNTPIKFIVMVVPQDVPLPDLSKFMN